MFIEEVIGPRDIARVPSLPTTRLITSDKHDRLTYWVKSKKDAELCPTR